jgi:signal peptidase I
LGQWLRAALWAGAPSPLLLLLCAFAVLAPLHGPFAWFVPTLLLVWGLAWCGTAVDVWLVPRARFRKTASWKLPMFWLGSVAFSVALAFAARTFFLQAFRMPAGSMQPTLMVEDRLFVNMRAFHAAPRRGQLAVFTSPEHPDQDFIKRIIALPGDRLSVSAGHPTINGWPVPHCLVGRARLPERQPSTDEPLAGEVELEFLGNQAFLIFKNDRGQPGAQGPWSVPPGEVFVLGDNRNSSYDSRSWFSGRGGGVPLANLSGQPLFVWLAFNPDGSTNRSRYGLPLDDAALGNWAPELAAGLRDCLTKRPPLSETEPPPPGY